MRATAPRFLLVLAAVFAAFPAWVSGSSPVLQEASAAQASTAGSSADTRPGTPEVRGTRIQFPEPVVSHTVVELSGDDSLPAADRGTDLFTISGGLRPLPTAHWVDQDSLRLIFPEGSSCATEFCLTFKPGTTYLSQKQMEPRTIRFYRPSDATLEARHLSGTPDSFLVSPNRRRHASREEQTFSAQSPVTYKFRSPKCDKDGNPIYKNNEWVYDQEVPATARPSTLADGLSSAALALLVKDGPDKLRSLKPGTRIPGQVVVSPDQPLDPSRIWELWAYAGEHSAFRKQQSIRGVYRFKPASLTTLVRQDFQGAHPVLTVTYTQDLSTTCIPSLFRRLILRVGEHTATLNPDGTSWQLVTPEQTLTFRLAGCADNPTRVSCPSPQKDGATYHYEEPDTTRAFSLEISGLAHPAVLDITLPEDTQAKRGLAQEFAITHRITLNPSVPLLRADSPPAQLPLTGSHALRFQTLNQQAVRVKAYHWEADRAAAQYDLLQASLLDDTNFRLASYIRQLLKSRDAADMPHDLAPHERDAMEGGWKILRREQKKTHRRAALAGATVFPDCLLPAAGSAPAGEASPTPPAAGSNSELTIDLDTLTGGNTRPGLYLIAVTTQPSAAVREALRNLGQPETALDCTTEYLVQVSDLQATTRETLVSLFSGTDGAPIRDARARFFIKPEPGWFGSEDSPRRLKERTAPRAFRDGIMQCEKLPHMLLIQSGDDYLLLPKGRNDSELNTGERNLSLILTDRNLYRPGDTVHLHSITRCQSADNRLRIPKSGPGKLTVRKPNGEILLTQKVTFDAFGSCDVSFTLPTGEEDITGAYAVQLESDDNNIYCHTTIRSAVFRRDSMSGELRLELDPIAPGSATVRIQGRDLNGASLAGARAELTLTVPGDLTAADSPLTGQSPPWQRNESDSITRKLILDSNGCAEFKTDLRPLGSHSSGFTVRAEATLTNDREEHCNLTTCEQRITPGSLVLELDGSQLTVKTPGGAPSPEPQTVRARIYSDSSEQTPLSNGFMLEQRRPACLRDLTLTVPANCTGGIPLPLMECSRQAEQNTLTILLETRDTSGRHLAQLSHWYRWNADEAAPYHPATARCENRQLIIPATFESAGEALVTLHAGRSVRSVILPVKAGPHEYSLALQPGESGTMDFCLTRMERDARGICRRPVTIAGSCEVPFTGQNLRLELELPGGSVQPGTSVTLSGTAHQADGQPAADAAVTFYAVDAGMLSLTGYDAPDPLHLFYGTKSITFRHTLPLDEVVKKPEQPLQPRPLPGLWLGDIISGPVGDFSPWELLNSILFNYSGGMRRLSKNKASAACAPAPVVVDSAVDAMDDDAESGDAEATTWLLDSGSTAPDTQAAPRLRTNFIPVAFWQGNLRTDAQGRFCTTCTLPDTLTTYRVFAVAASRDGQCFGTAESELTVNQPVMLTPGTPLFMSTGDTLRLPLTLTNNTGKEDTWTVTISNGSTSTPGTTPGTSTAGTSTPEVQVSPSPQQIRLAPGETGTLFFDVSPKAEGSATLTWTAQAASGGDAVAGSFDVRFPAPVLRESHRLVLQPGQEPTAIARLLAPELAASTRGSIRIGLSANPMIHLAGCADFLCGYPYGCTEQTSSALLPYLLHKRLAPFTPSMSALTEKDVQAIIDKSISKLFDRQQRDGGLSYWSGHSDSCPWASAYAGMVLTIADELGYDVPRRGMRSLRSYLRRQLKQDAENPEPQRLFRTLTLYAAGRTLGDDTLMDTALQQARAASADVAARRGRDRALPDLLFISSLRKAPGERHTALLTWLRSRGHDYRHRSSWSGGWTLLALAEYLKLEPADTAPATVRTDSGQQLTLGNGITTLTPPDTRGTPLRDLATTLSATQGTVYANVHVRALPETTHFPGVTEKGLQVTRLYEKKSADGIWRPATEFAVGDVIRITLTCAKMDDEVEYLVLEDYLPASMEAINPDIPSQAAGLEPLDWSLAFDHREYLADRVRGFCTRWATRGVVNLRYYARVKRAGTATAPPASAQLMYEPQCYGLSENQVITTK